MSESTQKCPSHLRTHQRAENAESSFYLDEIKSKLYKSIQQRAPVNGAYVTIPNI